MSTGGIDFLLLGPLEIRRDGEPVDLGIPPRSNQARLLAVLLRRLGSTVPASRALAWVWDDQRSADSLTKCVTNLRAALGRAGIGLARVGDGYRLEGLEQEGVDVYRFARLRAEAKATLAADPQAAVRLLRQAIGLRRGTPLVYLDCDYLRGWRVELEDRLRAARRELLRLELEHDGGDDVLSRIVELHTEEPADLESAALAMVVLYREGAREQAVDVYRRTRSTLTSAVAGAPTTTLDPIHDQMIAGTFDPDAWLGDGRPTRESAKTPWHLPPALPTFTGRETELTRLDKALADVRARRAVGIVGIEGEAGVGKTKLAVRWAQQVAHRFPDGLLHLDLIGFSNAGEPMHWAEGIGHLLHGLGLAAAAVPRGPTERLNAFRTTTKGLCLLILLDNAGDANQVRHLVPAGIGSLVLVTSRRELRGLQATDGATVLRLGVPGDAEARQMLAAYLPDDRVAAEPAAAGEILTLCGRLPLALAIVGAQAAAQPAASLATVAGQFSSGLADFPTDDDASNIPGLLDCSLRTLTDDGQRTARLLGAHPGPSLDPDAVSALVDRDAESAKDSLGKLASVHLLNRDGRRFTLHDLIRGHFATLFSRLPAGERHAATRRLLDHYLHTADACASILRPYRQPLTLDPPAPGARPRPMRTAAEARAWLSTEHDVLLRLLVGADDLGFPGYGWRLLAILADHFDWHGRWVEWATAGEAAAASAERASEPSGVARSRRSVGRALHRARRFADAERELRTALELYRGLGDSDGQSRVLHDLGALLDDQGRYTEALWELRQAQDLVAATGPSQELADVLTAMAWLNARLGNREEALEVGERALAQQNAFGYLRGQAAVLDTLGMVRSQLGRYPEALADLERAADLCAQVGDLPGGADVDEHLGDCYHAMGEPARAAEAWQRAAGTLERLANPRAADVRRKIDEFGAWGA